MTSQQLQEHAESIRSFNRFYTRQIGVVQEHLLNSEFSLTESRILWELANRETITSTDLCRELGLNAGYLSRVISNFEKKGLLNKTRSASDARAVQLELTQDGRATFEKLNHASQADVVAMLSQLTIPEQLQLVDAMHQVQSLLNRSSNSDSRPSYILRDPNPGDMAFIVHRQTLLYAQEYGWTNEFEALASEICAKFIRGFDHKLERCWIAEKDREVVGSVFIVRHDDGTAKLRMLYVDPIARGLGIGTRLVEECLRFAKQVGYKTMILWTNSVLTDARRIYDKFGFQLIEETPHHSFGKDLIGQTFSKEL